MSYTIAFGIIKEIKDDEPVQICVWPGKFDEFYKFDEPEDDGTRPSLAVFSGQPSRRFSNGNFRMWLEDVPEARQLLDYCHFELNGPSVCVPLTNEVIGFIEAIAQSERREDWRDESVWLNYWARRAMEEFGELASINLE